MHPESTDARDVFSNAQWIWPLPQGYDLVNYFCQARRVFRLEKAPRRCRIVITADARYKLFVNARYVCRGPARGFQESWPYDRVDIGPYLKKGKNVIAVLIHSYGHGTNFYVSHDAAGLILKGRAGKVDLSTGPGWQVRRAPGYGRHLVRATRLMGFQERFDARLDDGSWIEAGFDAADWQEPCRTAAGAMPWHFVEPRAIPMAAERIITPRRVTSECRGKSAGGWREVRNLTSGFLAEKRRWQESRCKLRRSAKAAAFTAEATGRGRYRSYLVDFGEEVVGSIIIELAGAAGGEVVDLQVSETVTGLCPGVASPEVDCNVALCNRLVAGEGRTRWEQFEPWGFRYVAVTVRDSAKSLPIRIALRSATYPLEVKARFESSSPSLEAIYGISVNAQRNCMMDAYVDCPWREQAQWWGDARVQGANTFYLSADTRLFERGIRQTAAQETPNALTYGLAPSNAHHCILPDYTLTWIETLWDHYWQTGETKLVSEQAERMWRALGYFDEATGRNGLLPYDKRYWLFLDWADLVKDGYPTVYNLMYLSALATAQRLFALIGAGSRAGRCGGRARRLKAAILKHLYVAESGVLRSGLKPTGAPLRREDPHSYALAVLCDLVPKKSRVFAAEKLAGMASGPNPKLTGDARGLPFTAAATPSPFFMHYVFEALKKTGHRRTVVECIERWWRVFLDRGFTTTGETWTHETGLISACHAWSAHPIVHLSNVLLGVTQSAAGWREIHFEPLVGFGRYARGSVATPMGLVRASWSVEEKGGEVALRLPRGMRARVRLPGTSDSVGAGRHVWRVSV